ncbi:hypothetical protein ACFWMR_02185 [Amycolatopsis thailandensis]|uniref:hypothetical protein n=1 Tax=Amycolatopsis thailandensis TaxID=589330 RepID=UPI0036621040
MPEVPPIPARCAARPTIGGRVIPWINVRLADGGVDFRAQHTTRLKTALNGKRCQVCSEPLTSPIVLLGGPTHLRQLLFDEPPLHPECAVYTSHACPVVNGTATSLPSGRKLSDGTRGQQCFVKGCDCGGWIPTPGDPDRQHPTEPHPWFAIYATGFNVAVAPDGEVLGALLMPAQVRRVRLVSRPGEGRCWTTVTDALAGYEAPDMHPATEGSGTR